jgi:hypothetical protein
MGAIPNPIPKNQIMKAVNKKHQVRVTRAVNWLMKHNEFNSKRDHIENNLECEEYESKEWRQINKKCEDSWDKYQDYTSELPKREVEQIEKSELY